MTGEQSGPAAANLSRSPEETFKYLLDQTTQAVFARVALNQPLPLVQFISDKESGALLDVQFIDAEKLGPAELRIPRSPWYSGPGYYEQKVSVTEKSMLTGQQTEETTRLPSHSPDFSVLEALPGKKYDTADPETVARGFLYAANSITEVDAVLDFISSDTFLEMAQAFDGSAENDSEVFKLSAYLGNPIAKRIFEHPDDIPALQESLLRHMGETTGVLDFGPVIHKIDTSLSRRLAQRLQKGTVQPKDAILQQVADFLAPFEALDMLAADNEERQGVLRTLDLAVHRPFTELLLRNLVKRPVAERRAQKERNGWYARMFLQKKLDLFARAPERHSGRVARVRQELFPDQMRENSLSRLHLIRLSNAITRSRNSGLAESERAALIDETRPGGIIPAITNVLNATLRSDLPESAHAAGQIENNLVSTIISLLLETRPLGQHPPEAEMSVAALEAYVLATLV